MENGKRKELTLKPNWYMLITRAVEEGVERGYTRAYKHTDSPEEHFVKDTIVDAVMLEICEIASFNSNVDTN